MHTARTAYEHPWTGPTAVFIGSLAIALGIAATGHLGSACRTVGIVVFLAGMQQINTFKIVRQGHVTAHRDGYKRGRRAGKPVVVFLPVQGEQTPARQQ